jgi:hypothetical protein
MMVIPPHCHKSGRSLKKKTAIVMVQSGLLARIGAAIDIGRCLRANDAKIQELPAISDFRNNRMCPVPDSDSTRRK